MRSQHGPFGTIHAVLIGTDSWADTGPVTAELRRDRADKRDVARVNHRPGLHVSIFE